MRHLFISSAMTIGLFHATCQGQSLLDQVNFRGGQIGGVHLYGVSVYGGYSTSPYPNVAFGQAIPSGLPGTAPYGTSATFGWLHPGQRTNVSASYSVGYSGVRQQSGTSSFWSQGLSLNVSRTLTSKWSVTATAGGQLSTLSDFIFQPASL